MHEQGEVNREGGGEVSIYNSLLRKGDNSNGVKVVLIVNESSNIQKISDSV